MFFGEVKFREILDRFEQQIGVKTRTQALNSINGGDCAEVIEKLELEIKDTENKLIELFMSRYQK